MYWPPQAADSVLLMSAIDKAERSRPSPCRRRCGTAACPPGRWRAHRSAWRCRRRPAATGCARPSAPRGRAAAVVLQVEVEAAGGAEFRHRRRREREDQGVLDLHLRAPIARPATHRRCSSGDLRSLPVLQVDEGHAGVLAAAAEAEALHRRTRTRPRSSRPRGSALPPFPSTAWCAPASRPPAPSPARTARPGPRRAGTRSAGAGTARPSAPARRGEDQP